MKNRPESLKCMRSFFYFFLIVLLGLFVMNGFAGRASAASMEKFPEKMKNASYVGMDSCTVCHDKENKEFQLSSHSRISLPKDDGTVVQGCEACHGPGSVHVDESGGKDNIATPRKNPETCYACHLDKKIEFKLPYHHPVDEGKMSCTDCHDSHGTDARPWTTTSLEGVNDVCFKCHKEQRGPFVFEHEALREGCTTCHKVHGSINDKMLLARDSNLCLRCHTQLNFPRVGDSNHAQGNRLTEGPCFSGGCHTAPHGSNFDDHLRY